MRLAARGRMSGAAAFARCLCLISLVVCAVGLPVLAQPGGQDAQRRLERVQRELRDVAGERRRLEGQRGAVARELRAVDERVAHSSRALHEAESALVSQRTALQQLQDRRAQLREEHATRKQELALLLRAAYRQGGHAPLKVLLAQDRVADAQRQLGYYGYLQRQRVQRSAELLAELNELERVERQIAEKQTALAASRNEQQARLATLSRDRETRAETLKSIDTRYQDRRAREQALGGDEKALRQLVTRLRAAAARAAAERAAAERASARQAVAARQAARAKPGAGANATRARSAATPRAEATRSTVARAAPVRVGGFGWPLSGDLLAGYGGRMPDGRASNGLLISAAQGTPVRAVADGTVVFAEWMTGYGLILIVDHGGGYLSLYAHNESLLKDVGADIKRGDAVARVGNSGGLAQSALYFELRRNGQPVDPGSWLRRQ